MNRISWARGLAGLALLLAPLATACGSADDGGLLQGDSGAGNGGAGGAICDDLRCYDQCVCEGGEPSACLDQCSPTGGSGGNAQGGSAQGGSGGSPGGNGGSGNAGSGAVGGSGNAGSGAMGGSGNGGSGNGGSGNGGSGNGGSGGTCDPNQCPDAQGGFLPGCCAASGACGFELGGIIQGAGCIQSNQQGELDPSCPATSIQGQTVPGCCRADNTCGYMDSFLGLGCVSPTDFGGPPGGGC